LVEIPIEEQGIMETGHIGSNIEYGSWSDFRNDVKKVNVALFNAIEKFNPSSNLKLLKVKYSYGQQITDIGKICLPNMGSLNDTVNIENDLFPSEFKKNLSYAPTPLIMQLSNSSEVYIDFEDYTSPLNIFKPGDLYGIFETLVPLTKVAFTPSWSVTSGARSAFMLPKVTSQRGVSALHKKYGTPITPPSGLKDHWHIFKKIANDDAKWHSEVIIFTQDWFQRCDNDLGWMTFYNYLLEQSWKQSKNIRIEHEDNSVINAFSSQMQVGKFKANPYIIDTILHCLKISSNCAPGFMPINNSQDLLPVEAIEYAYTDIYKNLHNLAPIIMGASNIKDCQSIYYSLSFPTLIHKSPFIRQFRSYITESINVQHILSEFNKVIEKNYKNDMRPLCSYKVYNFEQVESEEVLSTSNLLAQEPFISIMKKFKNKDFPLTGNFMKSLIEISFN